MHIRIFTIIYMHYKPVLVAVEVIYSRPFLGPKNSPSPPYRTESVVRPCRGDCPVRTAAYYTVTIYKVGYVDKYC